MRTLSRPVLILLVVLSVLGLSALAEPVTPGSVRSEHEDLRRELEAAGHGGGRVPQAVRRVNLLLAPHFEKEEQLVFPLLGVLPDVAAGRAIPERAKLVQKGRALETALPAMLAEHHAVAQAADEMMHVAREEKQFHVEKLGEELRLHTRNEEEVLYPAAILVGKQLAAWE